MWKGLWNIQCPPRVHHFLWRFTHNSHPLHMNIARKGVELDTRCVVCRGFFEDGGHLFFKCKAVKPVWRSLNLEVDRCRLLQCHNAKLVMEEICQMQPEKRVLTVSLLWCWWNERNNRNHGDKPQSVDKMQYLIQMHANEWKQFSEKKPAVTLRPKVRWVRPPADYVKINSDGAYATASGYGGWGCIARGDDGAVLFASAGFLPHIDNALPAEAITLINSITLADLFAMGHVIFETDCQTLAQAVTSSDFDLSPMGTLFREAKFLLRLANSDFRVVFTSRACNKAAHMLASLGAGRVHGNHVLWSTDFPDNDIVSRTVADDLVVHTI